jgi:hypothetical protein
MLCERCAKIRKNDKVIFNHAELFHALVKIPKK